MRAEAASERPPGPNIRKVAQLVHEGIAGLGTDEEKVYGALQQLDRDPQAIERLKVLYHQLYGVGLLEDIHDDFSGSELEYALQLLNEGRKKTPQTVEAHATEPQDFVRAAKRLRQAVEGPGTDEEAIYAVLLPFKRRTLELQDTYQKLYKEDLRDRLVDEMSGSQLDYALSLFETPYQHYLQEGNERLAGAPFGSFGDIRIMCGPEEREMSSGVKRTYWWDREWWEPDADKDSKTGRLSCKVKVLPNHSPAAAIDAMFDHQDRWKIACAEFVQITHLYALRHTLGAKKFDQTVAGKGFTLEVRRRQSTGLRTKTEFVRTAPDKPMVRSDTNEADPRKIESILWMAPIGSRVRWTNRDPRAAGTAWQNENTIKLGPDNFGAHGTASGVCTKDNTHSRAEVELLMSQATNSKADASYIARNIFISEIEIFKAPEEP